MPPSDQSPEQWGAIAPEYETSFEAFSAQFAAHAVRLLAVGPADRVLDVAAGTGAFSLLAAQTGAEVLATDFAPGMVAHMRARFAAEGLTRATADVMDGQALEIPDGTFDVAASVLGLIFFPDIPRGVREMRRVLRPGGRAAIVCWADPGRLELMTLTMQAIRAAVPDFEPPPGPPTWARLGGPDALAEQMRQAGFKDVGVTPTIGTLEIASPGTFWAGFTKSAPPLAHLFERLGPERTAAVGHAYMGLLDARSGGALPTLEIPAVIGVGRA